MTENNKPHPFLEVRVHSIQPPAGFTGLCAAYESGQWQFGQLASHFIEWLPDFALNYVEKENLSTKNAIALIAKAAKTVYSAEQYRHRAKLFEILLHIAVRQVFDGIPIISKLFFTDSSNGIFRKCDSVYVVATETSFQLWLGGATCSDDIHESIHQTVESIIEHSKRNYLRTEFITILNKPNPSWPHTERLKLLLDKDTTLDKVFDVFCFPVFFIYNSAVIATSSAVNENFLKKYEIEVHKHLESLRVHHLPEKMIVHIFLLPVKSINELEKEFDTKLQTCQSLLG